MFYMYSNEFISILKKIVFVAMVTVPSYGYAEAKPVKCEKPCSIDKKQNGTFILRNEYLSAEIDNMGRIITLTLNGDERYST